MATEMLRRAAAAIAERRCQPDFGTVALLRDGTTQWCIDHDMELARAAIRAMKTPTVEMYDAAWENIQINPELEQARQKLAVHDFRLLIRNIFGAMCRTALGEDEGHG